jgi:predicted RNase H-like nuclease (RuvC/YqgF family)
MDEGYFHKKLSDLVSEIETMPEVERTKLAKLAEETKHRHEQLKKTVSSLQESIDFLRLSIKYLLFDLEATKRENAQLRKMLDERSGS